MKFTGERMIPEKNKGELIYLEHLSRYIFAGKFVKGKKVLDIACGSGYGCKYLADRGAKKIIGVDNSAESIKYAKQKYSATNIEYIIGDAHKIPLDDDSVEIVVSFETIEHLPRQVEFVKEIRRVLTNSGLLLISSPNLGVYPAGNPFHVKELDQRNLELILKKEFKQFTMFYQNNRLCSSIMKQDSLQSKPFSLLLQTELYNLESSQPADSLYLVALCSNDKTGVKVAETAVLADDFESFKSKELINLQKTIFITKQSLEKTTNELKEIKNSRSWKLILKLKKFLGFFGWNSDKRKKE